MAGDTTTRSAVVIITGASGAYGRQIAIESASRLSSSPNFTLSEGARVSCSSSSGKEGGSAPQGKGGLSKNKAGEVFLAGESETNNVVKGEARFLLGGRDMKGLEKTAEDLRAAFSQDRHQLKIILFQADLAFAEDKWESCLDSRLDELEIPQANDVYLFMNHGSIDPVGHAEDLKAVEIEKHMKINFSSHTLLVGKVVKLISKTTVTPPPMIRFINVTSKLSKVPIGGLGMYCASRCAREMFLNTLRNELMDRKQFVHFKLLNWAPGPMETKLTVDLRGRCDLPLLVEAWKLFDREGQWVKVDDSASRLFTVLSVNTYSSGDHVDYYQVGEDGISTATTKGEKAVKELLGLSRHTISVSTGDGDCE